MNFCFSKYIYFTGRGQSLDQKHSPTTGDFEVILAPIVGFPALLAIVGLYSSVRLEKLRIQWVVYIYPLLLEYF